MPRMIGRAIAVAALLVTLATPAMAPGQVATPAPLAPQCQANKAAASACTCGLQPAAICPTGSWCTFTPEGAPLCSRRRPLH